MNDTTKLIQRIKALLEKTVENGCTEVEAMAAAEKASKLMAEHDVTMTDIELGATECKKHTVKAPEKGHPLQYCLVAVAYLCDCKVWLDNVETRVEPTVDLFGEKHGGSVRTKAGYTFFGLEHDVQVAEYFTEICRAAMDRGAADFRASFGARAQRGYVDGFRFGYKPSKSRQFDAEREFRNQLPSFLKGMATSMSKTLRDMKDARRREQIGTGRDLMVVKTDIVEREFKKLGMRLERRYGRSAADSEAYSAGKQAGANVRFHSGVSGSGRARYIGRA